jgi:GNAT superfamily N-acetyltransferase
MSINDTKLSEDNLVFQYKNSNPDNISNSVSREARCVCVARQFHVEDVKYLADANRHIFGFITRRAFYDAFQSGTLIVALQNEKVVGFLRYHHRKRDLQTTLYDICVAESERGKNLGKGMLQMLIDCCHKSHRALILLKCPAHLDANTFYEKNGFRHIDTIAGKRQKLNVWQLDLNNGGHQ